MSAFKPSSPAVLNPQPVTNPNAARHAECYSFMC